ncbi:MAG: arginine--tRNA ligase, partial [Patescibacteria group bacterium]|nr:arginine--tRNA ligase [Patescibacteria group bacterium]
RKKIVKLIGNSIKNLQGEKIFPEFKSLEIQVERPENKNYGDYTTNIALKISSLLKKNPIKIASIIEKRLSIKKLRIFEKIEVVRPGFINFFLSKEYLQGEILRILEDKKEFGNSKIKKNKKVQIEFISANPTGPLTVGNARGGPFGDVLGNILKRNGWNVKKAYYVNDYGNQILILGHSILKDSQAQYKGEYIDKLSKAVIGKNPKQVGKKGAKIIIKGIQETTQRLGIKYDEWLFESSIYKTGLVEDVLEVLKKRKLTYEKDGATWFKSTKYGDIRDRVLIKSDNSKTYLAGDIAFHQYKFKEGKFDKVINIWGADHYGDVPGLKAGVKALSIQKPFEIILHQFVTFLEKGEKMKMSKRKGKYLTMDELLDQINPDIIRFFFLKTSINTHLNFDLDLAKEQSEKNPVFYIQYAYARICAMLRKCKTQNAKGKNTIQNLKLLEDASELNLIKELIRFPEIIENTAIDYQVQRLPNYALELVSAFHKFYEECRVLTDDKKLAQARLGLV